MPSAVARSRRMTPDRGEYLTAFETRLSTTVRSFSPSPVTSAGASFASNDDHPRERGELVLAHDAAHDVGQLHRPDRRRLHRARLVVREQVLDQLLQRQRVLADDAHDVLLLRRQRAADVVAQELGAFAHRGQRRLELVRDVAQEAVLLLLEIGQPGPQPLEPLPEVAQVLRSVDLDRMGEVGGAQLADRLVELADRSRDQHGEHDRERHGDARGGEGQPGPLLSTRRRGLGEILGRAVGERARRDLERLRAVGKPRVAVGELQLGVRAALARREPLGQPPFAGVQRRERRGLRRLERQLRERARGLA